MRRLITIAFLLSFSASAWAAQTRATADSYDAVAFFTSGLVDGTPIDRIDMAHLGQDYIVLYVDWDRMRTRAYRTEVRIIDPNGEVVGKTRTRSCRGAAAHIPTTITGPAFGTHRATGPTRCMSMVVMLSKPGYPSSLRTDAAWTPREVDAYRYFCSAS